MLRNSKLIWLVIIMMNIITTYVYAQDDMSGAVKPAPFLIGETKKGGAEGEHKTEIQNLPWSQASLEESEPIKYDYIREADVFWSKIMWRVIDCREKMNRPFVAPKMPLITVLLNAAENGEVTLYDGLDDNFTTPVADLNSIPALSSTTDSTWVWNPETEVEELMVITNDFNPETVNKFRIKEVWFFNEETSNMEVRILGIAPIMEKYGELGDYQGDLPLFWAYFPDLRQSFVETEAYNPLPNGIKLTFDQIFAMRLFSSYIVKEDNVEDMRIQDYAEGIDALYESERIKEQLFNFEHDLWEY